MAKKQGPRFVGAGAGDIGVESTPVGAGELSARAPGIAAFFYEVSKDQSGKLCGCERCCNYRDISRMLMNPGSQY